MDAVLRKPKLMRALTSLEPGEFARLLAAFEQSLQAIRQERGDSTCRSRLGEAARDTVAAYTWYLVAQHTLEAYEKALTVSGNRTPISSTANGNC